MFRVRRGGGASICPVLWGCSAGAVFVMDIYIIVADGRVRLVGALFGWFLGCFVFLFLIFGFVGAW